MLRRLALLLPLCSACTTRDPGAAVRRPALLEWAGIVKAIRTAQPALGAMLEHGEIANAIGVALQVDSLLVSASSPSVSPASTALRTDLVSPLTRNRPSRIHCCRRVRENSGNSVAAAWSRRTPAALAGTIAVREMCSMVTRTTMPAPAGQARV